MKKIKMTIKPSRLKRRVVWGFNPATRIVPAKKIYNRANLKAKLKREVY